MGKIKRARRINAKDQIYLNDRFRRQSGKIMHWGGRNSNHCKTPPIQKNPKAAPHHNLRNSNHNLMLRMAHFNHAFSLNSEIPTQSRHPITKLQPYIQLLEIYQPLSKILKTILLSLPYCNNM